MSGVAELERTRSLRGQEQQNLDPQSDGRACHTGEPTRDNYFADAAIGHW